MNKGWPYQEALSVPMLTCAAFATEIYLKSLLVLNKRNPTMQHDLKFLFMQLPIPVRAEIRRDWDGQFNASAKKGMKEENVKFDLITVLASQSDWFERFRYWHE